MTLASPSARSAAIAAELSVEPSSTNSSSHSVKVCAATVSKAPRRNSSSLKNESTTDTTGPPSFAGGASTTCWTPASQRHQRAGGTARGSPIVGEPALDDLPFTRTQSRMGERRCVREAEVERGRSTVGSRVRCGKRGARRRTRPPHRRGSPGSTSATASLPAQRGWRRPIGLRRVRRRSRSSGSPPVGDRQETAARRRRTRWRCRRAQSCRS